MSERQITRLVSGRAAVDGAGVRLNRVLDHNSVEDFDPFLLLDAFDSVKPEDYVRGFPMHPHRGIETFTYLMHGFVEHKDSLGNKGVIKDGCCQWMTAGSGILHQEMPQAVPHLLGLQLWINLPRLHKMTEPKYRDLERQAMPVVEENGVTMTVVTGSYHNVHGAANGDYAKIRFLDVQMLPGAIWQLATEPENTVFLYLVSGSLGNLADEQDVQTRQAALFSLGDSISLKAGPEGARFVLAEGRPLHEPIAWGGPIVMNSDRELRQAFQELEDNTFLKHSGAE